MANMAGDPLPPRSFMLIGVPFETALGETRVAVTSESAKKRIAQGHVIRVQSGAGVAASVTDAGYQTAGAEITDQAEAFGADVVLNPGGLQGQDVDHEQALDGRGLAGLDNELFYMDKTMMVFGDAKKVVEAMAKAIE